MSAVPGIVIGMTATLNDLLDFTSFTHDIRSVKRSMWVKSEELMENDSEHSFQVALIALYLIEQNNLPLDAYKAMGLALVHDILEVHAGDTYIYGTEQDRTSKQEREAKAVDILRRQWPEQRLMLQLIDEYEAKITAEARFVYALDKLVPILNNILDDGRNWQRDHITLTQLQQAKTKKIALDAEIERYYGMILVLLRSKPELFSGEHKNG